MPNLQHKVCWLNLGIFKTQEELNLTSQVENHELVPTLDFYYHWFCGCCGICCIFIDRRRQRSSRNQLINKLLPISDEQKIDTKTVLLIEGCLPKLQSYMVK